MIKQALEKQWQLVTVVVSSTLLTFVGGCVNPGSNEHSSNAEQQATLRGEQSGRQLFENNCAACHGANGKGRPVNEIGFDYPLPDFTDCSFNSPEQSADWVAIAHEGGPIRGFTPIMPAFGDALTTSELEKLVEYVRGFCTDTRWPRGELNFPLPLYTEKAFPENETLLKTSIDKGGSSETKLIYEHRVGARGQYELVLPYVNFDTGMGHWQQGFGDAAIAYKHVLAASFQKGYILSAAAELALPTGSEVLGTGAGHATLESFLAFGKALPKDFFMQGRVVHVAPLNGATREAELHLNFGRLMTVGGPFGRQVNPMVELLGARELASGATTQWDWAPQLQISLNQRQHLLVGFGARLPLTERAGRDPQYSAYLLWDWFDGGLFDGW